MGAMLPRITLKLIDGQTLTVPDDIPSAHLALIFYRGHWCTQCRRHLTRYQEHLSELQNLGVTVVAASVDSLADTKAFADSAGLTFPVAYGVSAPDIAPFDPWWGDDDHGRYIQPTELVVDRNGAVLASMYGSGSVGRMPVEGVLFMLERREQRRREQERAAAPA
jgi:peroxiredoxin